MLSTKDLIFQKTSCNIELTKERVKNRIAEDGCMIRITCFSDYRARKPKQVSADNQEHINHAVETLGGTNEVQNYYYRLWT